MISYARESLASTIAEIKPLMLRHFDEVGQHDLTLDPDWQQLLDMERAGWIALFTVRNDGELVGYAGFFVRRHIHYREKTAINDVVFLAPEHRRGRVGLRLLRFAELGLRAMGAQKIYYHVKTHQDWSPILARLGYQHAEHIFSKGAQ